jgi:hypothetical protein
MPPDVPDETQPGYRGRDAGRRKDSEMLRRKAGRKAGQKGRTDGNDPNANALK